MAKIMVNRWSLYIDIEGFSEIYKSKEVDALKALFILMSEIYKLGKKVFTEDERGLFAHQTGDGFIILGEVYDDNYDKPIAISIYLTKQLLKYNFVCRAGISVGEFSDISGCYPEFEKSDKVDSQTIQMNDGILTIFPVMGEALINAVKIDKLSKKGPIITVDNKIKNKVDLSDISILYENEGCFIINWLSSTNRELENIEQKLNEHVISAEECTTRLKKYLERYTLKGEWVDNVNKMIDAI